MNLHKFRIVLFFFLLSSVPLLAQVKDYHRNLLTGKVSQEDLSKYLGNLKQLHLYPAYSDRKTWTALSEEVVKRHVTEGDSALGYSWKPISTALYRQFKESGNRSNFQGKYSEKRSNLKALFLAEMVKGDGKYLDNIKEGVVSIMDETSWTLPAHESLKIDMFAGETAALLASINSLLGKELEKVNPGISAKITDSIKQKFLNPVRTKDFYWMGNKAGQKINNWNPWIISNWIACELAIEDNREVQLASIYKAMKSLDHFLDRYPPDGGCDEGPEYWMKNGGSLFTCLDLLDKATGGKINIFKNPLIQAIGAYIYKVYIGGSYFVNFADTHPKQNPDGDIIYRYGVSIGDSAMIKFGAYLAKNRKYRGYGESTERLFSYDKAMRVKGKSPNISDFWLPDIQIFGGRSLPGTNKGLYLAGKGGTNGESHNHNDVGNYIIYANGKPFIVDVGVEEYTASSFGKNRYTIWTMQSGYHTLPTINNTMQSQGEKFKAKNVVFTTDETSINASLDIADSYPENAGVIKWERKIDFVRKEAITVNEDYELKKIEGKTFLTFMTPCKVSDDGKGKLTFTYTEKELKSSVILNYDPDQVSVETDIKTLTDRRLMAAWGKSINRIMLVVKSKKMNGKITYSFTSVDLEDNTSK